MNVTKRPGLRKEENRKGDEYRMMKKLLIGILVLAWVVLPLLVSAQGRAAGRWWRLPGVSKELHLRQDEKDDLDNLFTESRRKLIMLKSQVERAQFDLDTLLDKGTINDDAVRTQYGRLERARENLSKERFRFLLEVRRILGPERFDGLKRMYGSFQAKKRRNSLGRSSRE